MNPATQCVHSGGRRDAATGGLNTPIYPSTAFDYRDREVCYPRYFNTPNQAVIVEKLSALEGAESGVLFSSGMAAMTTTALAFVGAGDHVVLQEELYGGTHAFASDMFARLGIEHTFTPTDAAAVCQAVTARTRLIVVESPTNPLLSVIDLRQVAAFAQARGITTVVDNTFASPINQNPLALGLHVVVHSGTKYLGGHSDLCCGVVLTDRERAERILGLARHLGGSLNALTCYLLERSLKTLALRVERQSRNAGRLAEFLARHPAVRRVYYPGLPTHPGHAIARAQMRGFSGMLSFDLAGTADEVGAFLGRLRLIKPAVSLGGVESTICSPVATSHAKMSPPTRERLGITEGLLRLSVGIEDVDDLIADLDGALQGARA